MFEYHSHTMYSSGNIDVRNWVHLFESRCILGCTVLQTSNIAWQFWWTESLHSPVHPVAVAMFGAAIKETRCRPTQVGPTASGLSLIQKYSRSRSQGASYKSKPTSNFLYSTECFSLRTSFAHTTSDVILLGYMEEADNRNLSNATFFKALLAVPLFMHSMLDWRCER